jgi:hypothetical protein
VIGTRSGEVYELSGVAGAARLSRGTIVVADGGSRQLRFFDSTGAFIRAVGGPGDGPGEFRELQTFARLSGDTLVAGDPFSASYFTGDGRFLFRILSMRPSRGAPATPRLFTALLSGGTALVASYVRPAPRAPGTRWVDSIPLLLVDRENTVIRSMGNSPFFLFEMGAREPSPLRLGAQAVFATNRREVFLGFGNAWSIRVYSADGRLERIIRRNWTPVRTRGLRAVREMGEGPFADTVAAFSQFIADRQGGLWVRAVNPADHPPIGALDITPREPSTWSVFEASGRWIGDVSMPARFTPKDIGADYVLGVAADEDGTQTVALYVIGSAGSR